MGRYRFSGRMARAVLRGCFLLAAGVISGCDGDGPVCSDGGVYPECKECKDMPAPNDPKPGTPVACNRRIVIDPTKMCAPYSDMNGDVAWEGAPVFPEFPKGTLRDYCSYEWQIDGQEADASLLPLQGSDDCTFVAPQQAGPDPISQWAYEQFLASVNETMTNGVATTRPQARAPIPADGGTRTRVVVLDTSPDSSSNLLIEPGSRSRHGETLAYLIRDIACEDPLNCSVEVKTQLVMPWLWDQGTLTPEPGGGNVGSLGDVVQGLRAEILAYRGELDAAATAWLDPNTPDNGPALAVPSRLLFNESFGYADAGGTRCADVAPSQPSEADASLLFDTLQMAACLGSLHVAAAGNHTGGPAPSDGLMCPARWHKLIEPSQSTCETLIGLSDFQGIQSDFDAVTEAKYGTPHDMFDASLTNVDALVSVGAVDYGGMPIVLTRPNACSEFVALGVGGIGWDEAHTNPHSSTLTIPQTPDPLIPPALFGTSVSAAAVSGRLAAMWSQSGASADVAPTIVIKEERRVVPFSTGGACTHLAGPICSDMLWMAPPPATDPTQQNPRFPTLGDVLRRGHPQVRYTIQDDSAPVCTMSIPQCLRQTASEAPGASAHVWGQPTDPLCLKCGILADPYALSGRPPELWIDPSKKFEEVGASGQSATPGVTLITGAVLVVEDVTGQVVLTQALPPDAVTRSSLVELDIPNLSFAGARVWLSVYDDQGRAVSQQIFVHP